MNQTASSERIESIDILRGITILVMIFVNDLAGVEGVPAWMEHVSPPSADGMTFVDWVFPGFLFIVGMSIPFAIGRRLDRGEPLLPVWKHILIRTVSLLVIGVFMVNQPSENGTLNPNLWSLLMYAGVILLWNNYPKTDPTKQTLYRGLQIGGVALLLFAAVLFRGGDEASSFIELRPQWWGILGLIGWAYLVACIVYTLLRRNVAGMVGMVAILHCVYFADQVGFFSSLTWISNWVGIGSALGSHAAITVSGAVLGMMLAPGSPLQGHTQRIRWAFFYGLGLFTAGTLLHSLHDVHRMFIVNKIYATPPWCLLCSAYTVWLWAVIYWLVDAKGWKHWAVVVRPAGQNALFAFILAPIIYAVFWSMGDYDFYSKLGNSFEVGLFRSIIFAFGVTWLTAALRNVGLQLKL